MCSTGLGAPIQNRGSSEWLGREVRSRARSRSGVSQARSLSAARTASAPRSPAPRGGEGGPDRTARGSVGARRRRRLRRPPCRTRSRGCGANSDRMSSKRGPPDTSYGSHPASRCEAVRALCGTRAVRAPRAARASRRRARALAWPCARRLRLRAVRQAESEGSRSSDSSPARRGSKRISSSVGTVTSLESWEALAEDHPLRETPVA